MIYGLRPADKISLRVRAQLPRLLTPRKNALGCGDWGNRARWLVPMLLHKARIDVLELTGQNDQAMAVTRRLLADAAADPAITASLQQDLGHQLLLAGEYQEAARLLESAVKYYTRCGAKRRQAKAQNLLGTSEYYRGDYRAAFARQLSALELARQCGDDRILADIYTDLSNLCWNQGDYPAATAHLEKRLVILSALGDLPAIGRTHGNLAVVYELQGDYDKSYLQNQRSLDIGAAVGDKLSLSRVLGNIGSLSQFRGDLAQARASYLRQIDLCRELNDPRGRAYAVGNLGIVYNEEFDYDRAADCYRQQFETFTDLGDKRGIGYALSNMGSMYTDLGEYGKALDCYRQRLVIAQELGDKRAQCITLGYDGWARFLAGDPSAASQLDRSITLAREINIKNYLTDFLLHRAEVWLAQGDPEAARALNDQALRLAMETATPASMFRSRLLAARLEMPQHPDHALRVIRDLASGETTMPQLAELAFYRWRADPTRANSDQARALLTAAYQKSRLRRLKDLLDALA
ncbi:MAG: tetratricopeptide repeat protein [Candidatus Edwardsbacteria bacterium]|nr:tetratricopeptide repeat protein [Candidatus Edwardsbacteria bacterium]